MSTFGLPAEALPVRDTAEPSVLVLEAPEQTAERLTENRIIEEIVAAKAFLYGRVQLPGLRVERHGLYGKELTSTPIPAAGAEERQRVALADLELFKSAAVSPDMREALGEAWRVRFDGYSWSRDDADRTPVYTEAALLNPNFALLLSFDLDDKGYATGSKARLFMSHDTDVLVEAVRLAADTAPRH